MTVQDIFIDKLNEQRDEAQPFEWIKFLRSSTIFEIPEVDAEEGKKVLALPAVYIEDNTLDLLTKVNPITRIGSTASLNVQLVIEMKNYDRLTEADYKGYKQDIEEKSQQLINEFIKIVSETNGLSNIKIGQGIFEDGFEIKARKVLVLLFPIEVKQNGVLG